MKIDLKEEEKIAIANYLAEKNNKRTFLYHSSEDPRMKKIKEQRRQKEYKFFKKCLDETNDY